MPTLSKFIYTWPYGTTPVMIHDWITTLSKEEQDEFRLADIRQKEFRQLIIDQENLKLTNDGYVWKDKVGKPNDPTWLIYWNRWRIDVGVQFTVDHTEI